MSVGTARTKGDGRERSGERGLNAAATQVATTAARPVLY